MKGDIFYTVIQKLNEIPGINVNILTENGKADGALPDGKIQICRNLYQREWYVEIKTRLTPVMLP